MYIISKVTQDYEGTWTNPLMYDTDLNKAIEVANQLQESMISLITKYIEIKKQINFVLKKFYPKYDNLDVNYEEQLKSIDINDSENYFEKEERLLKEAANNQLNEQEKFLYDISYMSSSCQLIYFEVRKLHFTDSVLKEGINKENFWCIEYSTEEKAKQHKSLFNMYID